MENEDMNNEAEVKMEVCGLCDHESSDMYDYGPPLYIRVCEYCRFDKAE